MQQQIQYQTYFNEKLQKQVDLVAYLTNLVELNEKSPFESILIAEQDLQVLYSQLTYTYENGKQILDINFLTQFSQSKETINTEDIDFSLATLDSVWWQLHKGYKIISKILVYGNQISIEILHDWMNDYLDIVDLAFPDKKQKQNLISKANYFGELKNFYFMISKIQIERGDYDELQRFLQMGFSEFHNLIETVNSSSELKESTILQICLSSLFQFSEYLIQTKSIPNQIVIQYFEQLINNIKFAYEEISEFLAVASLYFASYLFSIQQFSQIQNILQPIFEVRKQFGDQDFLFKLLHLYHISLRESNTFEELSSIQKEIDSIQDVSLQNCCMDSIYYHSYMFNKELDLKILTNLEYRFNTLLKCVSYLYQQQINNEITASIPIFKVIDEILTTKTEFAQKETFKLQIFQFLKSMKPIKLNNLREEFEKQYYLAFLQFSIDKSLTKEKRLEELNSFIENFKTISELHQIFFEKLWLFIFILIEEPTYEQEAQNLITKVIQMIQQSNSEIQKDQFLELLNQQQETIKYKCEKNKQQS